MKKLFTVKMLKQIAVAMSNNYQFDNSYTKCLVKEKFTINEDLYCYIYVTKVKNLIGIIIKFSDKNFNNYIGEHLYKFNNGNYLLRKDLSKYVKIINEELNYSDI